MEKREKKIREKRETVKRKTLPIECKTTRINKDIKERGRNRGRRESMQEPRQAGREGRREAGRN